MLFYGDLKMSFWAGQDGRAFNALLLLFILMFTFFIAIFILGKSERVATLKFAFISKNNFKIDMFKQSKVCIPKSSFSKVYG